MPDYRGAQECYWLWDTETNGGTAGRRMLEPKATASPAPPTTFKSAGYSSFPTLSLNHQPVPVMSIGSYRMFDSYPGVLDFSLRCELIVGSVTFLKHALRSAALGSVNGYKGLPTLSLAFGSMPDYSDDFHWRARYCFIRELSFSFAVGQPLRATLDLVPLYVEFNDTARTISEAQVIAAGGEVVGWDNMDWVVAGEDYSHWLESAEIRVSNGIEPKGQRRNKGAQNPLSRVRRALVPTSEQVSVNYGMSAELESALRNGSMNATQWGQVNFNVSNLDSGGSKSNTIGISHNRLSSETIQGAQVGQTLSFSASTLSGFLSIT